jgi:hypothetical protein
MTDLTLITGLPGGPYRLTIFEPPHGARVFCAAEMCTCPHDGGPHWHPIVDATSLADLFTDLLVRFLSQEAHP